MLAATVGKWSEYHLGRRVLVTQIIIIPERSREEDACLVMLCCALVLKRSVGKSEKKKIVCAVHCAVQLKVRHCSGCIFRAIWNLGGMRDVILAIIVATNAVPRFLLGCAWMCGTFALKQTWIGTSRLGSLNVCIFHLTSSSPTCMLSGTIGIGPARGNGLANVIGALVLRGVISVFVRISCGTIRFKRFRSLGAFALRQKYVLCVYAFAVVLIHTVINASVLPCCYCRCHDVCIVD